MKFFSTVSVSTCAAVSGSWAQAQSYPDRPVRIIIPFPPGGATDTLARVVSLKMGKTLGQTLIVENRAGATGAIGSDAIAKAVPDGYNLLLATSLTHAIAPAINSRLPYDKARDFTPSRSWAALPPSCWCPTIRLPRPCKTWSILHARVRGT